MFIILTYDISVKRNAKVLKECRKYLVHVQKSVLEGHVSEKQLSSLKRKLQNLIDVEKDQIAIYKYKGVNKIEKEIIGYHITQNNII